MDLEEKIVISVLAVLAGVLVVLLFVMVPFRLYADAKCLAAGYPKAKVTVGLEMYCIGLDGAVKTTVSKLK